MIARNIMDMDDMNGSMEHEAVAFYIGHHEQSRTEVIDEDIFHHAEDLGVSCMLSVIVE